MLIQQSLQALLSAKLPAGTTFFLVAAVPLDYSESGGVAGAPGIGSVVADGFDAGGQIDCAKRDRLVAALLKVEPNDARAVVMKSLLATIDGEWLPFPSMVAAIETACAAKGKEASGRAQAALRDLSWQIKQYMPAADLTGLTVAIDILATRRRFGKETRYRLTQVGRAAIAHFMKAN